MRRENLFLEENKFNSTTEIRDPRTTKICKPTERTRTDKDRHLVVKWTTSEVVKGGQKWLKVIEYGQILSNVVKSSNSA